MHVWELIQIRRGRVFSFHIRGQMSSDSLISKYNSRKTPHKTSSSSLAWVEPLVPQPKLEEQFLQFLFIYYYFLPFALMRKSVTQFVDCVVLKVFKMRFRKPRGFVKRGQGAQVVIVLNFVLLCIRPDSGKKKTWAVLICGFCHCNNIKKSQTSWLFYTDLTLGMSVFKNVPNQKQINNLFSLNMSGFNTLLHSSVFFVCFFMFPLLLNVTVK